ncbi:MAG: helix-turn-helix domain-containing protein [Candidatus Sulfotelmatobacter sp.]
MIEKQTPLRARLHRYRLSVSEFSLLTAMCEHRSDGSTVWASISRLAAYSKLDERTVQRLIRGFCARGILSQLARGNAAKHIPATYRVNEAALEEDPAMAPYRSTGQEELPGIPRPAVPGEPIPDRRDPGGVVPPGVENNPPLVAWCHPPGGVVSPNSRSDSRSTTLPNPPFQGGNLFSNSTSKENARAREASEIPNNFHSTLTRRDRDRLNDRIYRLMEDPQHDFDSAMTMACGQLMIPVSGGRAAAKAAGIELANEKKQEDS